MLTIGPALNVPDTVSRLWPANALRRLQVLLNVVYVGWTSTLPGMIAIAPVAAAAQEIARLRRAGGLFRKRMQGMPVLHQHRIRSCQNNADR